MNFARNGREFSYQVVTHHAGNVGGAITAARFVCYRCKRETSINLGNKGVNSTNTVKRIRRAGWEADIFRKSSVICPVCVKARDARYDAHSQKAEERKKESAKVINIKPAPQSAPAPAVSANSATPLTPTQRAKCRDLLDEHFDVERGFYSMEWSDQRVAKEVGCGFAAVAQMREVAYGPLKGDPGVNEVRSEIQRCKADAAAILELVAKQDATISALEKRVLKIGERFSP